MFFPTSWDWSAFFYGSWVFDIVGWGIKRVLIQVSLEEWELDACVQAFFSTSSDLF